MKEAGNIANMPKIEMMTKAQLIELGKKEFKIELNKKETKMTLVKILLGTIKKAR